MLLVVHAHHCIFAACIYCKQIFNAPADELPRNGQEKQLLYLLISDSTYNL